MQSIALAHGATIDDKNLLVPFGGDIRWTFWINVRQFG
jgi:hypothetical protein